MDIRRTTGTVTGLSIATLGPVIDWDARDVEMDGSNNVTQYNDQSGNNNHAIPITGTQVWTADGETPYVQMTNAVAGATNALDSTVNKTTFVVYESPTTNLQSVYGVQENEADVGPVDWQVEVLGTESTADRIYYYSGDTTNGGGTTFDLPAFVADYNHVWCGVHGFNNRLLVIDGQYLAAGGTTRYIWDIEHKPTIGADNRKMDGIWRRMIVFDKILSPPEMDIVHAELEDIYGISCALWSEQAERCHLVMQIGQSNADGREYISNAKADTYDNFQTVTGVPLSNYDGDHTGTIRVTDGAVNTVNLAANTSNTTNFSDRLGLGTFLPKDLADRDGLDVYHYNGAAGGSILWDDDVADGTVNWRPRSAAPQDQNNATATGRESRIHYYHGSRYVDSYLDALVRCWDDDRYPYKAHIIRWQGEQDAHESPGTAASAYQANEALWNQYIKEDVGNWATLHSIRLHDDNDPTDQPYLATVIAAQEANEDTVDFFYDPSDTTLFDITHVTAAGMKVISDRILANI